MKSSRVRADSGRRQRSPAWRRVLLRTLMVGLALVISLVLLFTRVNPTLTPYMISERQRLGQVTQEWVSLAALPPVVARSVMAAEDARFCLHHGIDLQSVREVLASGQSRGASTISQQLVKNLYLWHGRSWLRKGLEAVLTPVVELFWSKHRILEVYLNIVEFDRGIFGVGAAARHYFGVAAGQLDARQSALLAAVLPNPKHRSASAPSPRLLARAGAIHQGARVLANEGRSACITTD